MRITPLEAVGILRSRYEGCGRYSGKGCGWLLLKHGARCGRLLLNRGAPYGAGTMLRQATACLGGTLRSQALLDEVAIGLGADLVACFFLQRLRVGSVG